MDGLHIPTVHGSGNYAYTASKAAVHHLAATHRFQRTLATERAKIQAWHVSDSCSATQRNHAGFRAHAHLLECASKTRAAMAISTVQLKSAMMATMTTKTGAQTNAVGTDASRSQ